MKLRLVPAPQGARWLLVLLAPAAAGCGSGVEARAHSPSSAVESVPRPDVLVVAVDGFSLDDIGVFGGDLVATAGFDQLAEEGTVYVDGFTPSPWPDEALASLLTGRRAALSDGKPWTPSLAESLKHVGYRTALVLGHEQHEPELLLPDENVSGFESTLLPPAASTVAGARADEVADAALAWLGDVTGPVLMVATFADPRPPHHLYSGLVPAADVPYEGPVSAGLSHAELLRRADSFTEDDRARLAELHASEIAMVDAQFMRLAGAVVARRTTPAVLVVVGLRPAALGQAGRYGLVPSFDPGALQVPIMMRFPEPLEPDSAPPLRGDVEVPASLADVGPTLLDSLGFEPRYDIDGRSLFPGTRLDGAREILSLTRRGLHGRCLISGDRAVSVQFAPDVERYYRRPSSAEPFVETTEPTSRELDLARRLRNH